MRATPTLGLLVCDDDEFERGIESSDDNDDEDDDALAHAPPLPNPLARHKLGVKQGRSRGTKMTILHKLDPIRGKQPNVEAAKPKIETSIPK